MFRRIIAGLGMSLLIAFTLTACGGSGSTATKTVIQQQPVVVQQADATQTQPQPLPKPKPQVQPRPKVKIVYRDRPPKPQPQPVAKPPAPKTVPGDLVGARLDVAENELDGQHTRYSEIGGGVFGIVARSNWIVCQTKPNSGDAVTGPVALIVGHFTCDSQ